MWLEDNVSQREFATVIVWYADDARICDVGVQEEVPFKFSRCDLEAFDFQDFLRRIHETIVRRLLAASEPSGDQPRIFRCSGK
jgi:hypothetical protein